MEEQLKEIEGLLETTTNAGENDESSPVQNLKKYVKLALPHVALVAVVCLYAIVGAYIFYRLESPNEDRLKAIGKRTIAEMRTSLISKINSEENNDIWRDELGAELMLYSDKLYKAFKEQYVRYSDVKNIGIEIRSSDDDENDRKRRHRHGKTRSEKSEKMWTASSALFFAATTMATIGYGNIVPATSSGRIACVIFALFGAPLAIITIGDLGKFLSECTIWLYKHMRRSGLQFQVMMRRFRGQELSLTDLESADRRKNSQEPDSSSLDWEDLVIDKTEVPVLMVFTILLLYIAFGGILFSILEDWSYMDAFYYSFISLTTIGFGDIVPENHDYIVIMLIYLGVGLSVTTMCIDLVGIQYIQKIHYFGRKFRGTDLLHLLKRKRMIERRLAMGQGEDILRMYVHHIEKEAEQIQQQQQMQQQQHEVPPLEEKSIHNSMMRIDDSLSAFNLRFYDTYDEEDVPTPTIHSIRSFQPSVWSASSARSCVYRQFLQQRERGDSWAESGPTLSDHCSLSTEPSVHVRQAYWDNYVSPTSSVLSFLHRHLYSPTFDYESIAKEAKQCSRCASCPPIDMPPSHESVSETKRGASSARDSSHAQQHVATCVEPLYRAQPVTFRLPQPFMLSNLAAVCDAFDDDPACSRIASASFRPSNLAPIGVDDAPTTATIVDPPRIHEPPPPVPRLVLSPKRLSIIDESKSPEPLLKRKHKERKARQQHPLHSFDWLNVSPRKFRPEVCIKDDLPKLFKFVRTSPRESSPDSVVLISPRSPIGLACMQDWDSYIKMLEEASKSFEYPPEDDIQEDEELDDEEIDIDEDDDDNDSRTPPSTAISWEIRSDYTENYTSSSTLVSAGLSRCFAPIVHYQTPCHAAIAEVPINNNCNEAQPIVDDVGKRELQMPSPIPLESQSSESDEEPIAVNVDALKQRYPSNEIDLGAFELVDSGLSPQALLSKDEPVIFHQSMPVHSVHHDTVQTEAALANLMSAPSSMLTDGIPPVMVEDNYCFVVDGERVRMGDILGDDQWWRHTSRPTKYFYSEDLRQFHRVNCITAKGKVITAKLATQIHQPSTSMSHHQNLASAAASSSMNSQPQHHSMTNTPRSSISGATFHSTPNRSAHHDANKVPLSNVYKVIRFYSFWKTCTSFHRIVTMIDKVVDEPSSTPAGGNTFKKRLFVQYLWRNAKAVEKARVQKEFDPRRQRLLRFVTDPAARKRFQKIFVEDDLFADIIDDNDNESESEEENGFSDDESQNNIDPQRPRRRQKVEIMTHPGKGGQAIPVYSNDDEHPLDGPHTILHAVQCPKKLVAPTAPSDVVDTSCFVCDGNLVTIQMIEDDSDNIHWKPTMSTTHYYATDNWKDDFYRVTPLMCRGGLRGAYRVDPKSRGKIKRVDIVRVYRVTRHFSCWKTVPIFHRVISLVEPAIPANCLTMKQRNLVRANGNKLIRRLFVQYFWRCRQSEALRDQVLREYEETSKKTRAKKSWIRVVKNVARLRVATSLMSAAQK
ncbi:unnamed protein product [Caenorhabditis bovis]|uniref:Potassium channel domain-containing protein n=1 Tax=Caenorhabditis bovis TaxID=2654633 RepID=A0A8S1EYJ1_9PELO|nr:unnamed protein product [Caenorhabditis bovis]